ncbi:15332_t:CDS:1, partial [Funneliformis geosporum]
INNISEENEEMSDAKGEDDIEDVVSLDVENKYDFLEKISLQKAL